MLKDNIKSFSFFFSLNEESCLRNSITLFLHTLIKHLLPVVDNNYEKLSLDQLIQEYIPNIIKALSSFSAVNELQNFGQSSAEQFQPPEVQFKPIVESLQELAELTLKLNVLSSEDKLISIGKAWLLLGHVYLMFFSKLELVDPIQKKAIKRQYTLEEVKFLLKVYNLRCNLDRFLFCSFFYVLRF